MSAVGRRYAKALIDLAAEQQQVDKVGKDLRTMADAWSTSKDLRDAFTDPRSSPELRLKIIDDLMQRALAAPLLRNALRLLSDRRRMGQLAEVADAYEQLAEARAGRVRAEVVSATPLSEAYFTELARVLETTTGKKVNIVRRVDSSLIAGVVTRVGDRVFDGSMKNRLEQLREDLLEHS